MEKSVTANDNSLQVIDRAFAVLEVMSGTRKMSLNELYTELKINKASLSRVLASLCKNGYISKDNETGSYSMTFKAFEIGIGALRNTNYYYFVKEALRDLSKRFNVIAQFSVEDNNELLCLESYNDNKNTFSVYTSVGVRSPLYATSAGKAILSTYQTDEIFDKWEQMNIRPYTEHTITTPEKLLQEISQIRSQGYAVDKEESELGLFCVGTVICNYNHQPIGAISVSTNEMSPERQDILGKAILEKSQYLNNLLGFSQV